MEQTYRFGISNYVLDDFFDNRYYGGNYSSRIEYIRDFLPNAKVEMVSFEFTVDDKFEIVPVTVGEKRESKYSTEWDMTLESGQVIEFSAGKGGKINSDKGFILFRKDNDLTLGEILCFSEKSDINIENFKEILEWNGVVITAPFEEATLKFLQMKFDTSLTIWQADKYHKDYFDFEIG